jgi:Uma2 family endonuclease
MVGLAKVPVWMTLAEFLDWSAATPGRWQLVDGEPQAMAPPNRTHGAIQAELAALISNRLRERDSPCTVIVGPGVVPRVQAAYNMRVPDLAVTCSGYESEEAALADPVLVVEILSPSNQAATWANVWTYTSIPSVREILVLRTVAVAADLLRRGADGSWPSEPQAVAAADDLVLDSIGLRVPLAALYRTTRLGRPPQT